MPVRACRSGTRLRPGYRYRRSTRGNKGSIRAHNPSLTKGFAMDTVYDNSIPKPLFVRRPKVRLDSTLRDIYVFVLRGWLAQ